MSSCNKHFFLLMPVRVLPANFRCLCLKSVRGNGGEWVLLMERGDLLLASPCAFHFVHRLLGDSCRFEQGSDNQGLVIVNVSGGLLRASWSSMICGIPSSFGPSVLAHAFMICDTPNARCSPAPKPQNPMIPNAKTTFQAEYAAHYRNVNFFQPRLVYNSRVAVSVSYCQVAVRR